MPRYFFPPQCFLRYGKLCLSVLGVQPAAIKLARFESSVIYYTACMHTLTCF